MNMRKFTKVVRVGLSGLLIGCLLFMLIGLLVPPVASGAITGDLEVTRDLPDKVRPEQQFDVTVTFTSPDNTFNNIGLAEQAPSSTPWPVSVDSAWVSPAPTFCYVADTNQVAVTWFAGPYASGTAFTVLYKVTVPAGTSTGTYNFAGTVPYVIGTTEYIVDIGGDTSVEVDATAPTVDAVSPLADATDVAVDTVVTATFSEAMDASTITTGSFTLAGSAVSGTVTYDPVTYKATFTPSANLAYGHTYTATLTTAITDVAGNPLAAEYTWSFTTGYDVEIQLAMLLDSSGSIGSTDFGVMTEGLATAVENPDCVPQDGTIELTVVRFASSASVVVGPVVITADNAASVAQQIRDIAYTGGSTCMSCAFDTAATALAASPYFSASLKQAINLVTDGWPNNATLAETARDNAITTLQMTEAQDEIDAEAIGAGAGVDWLKDYIVYPQPGYEAPPFVDPGWVRVVESADEFAETICEKMAVIITPAPECDFTARPRSGTAPLRVRFTDLSTGEIESWAWDFGDGNTSTLQNPTNTYANPGTYDVSLEATGPGGSCTETKTNYITVVAPEEVIPGLRPEPAKIGASYLYISAEQIVPSQWVEISANIYNRGGVKKSHTVALYINGYLAQSQTVGVSPGGTELVVFRVRADTEFLGGIYTGPGTYTVNVEGMEGQFFVLAQPETTTTGFFGGPLGTGGIIAIVVVVIVLIVGLVFGLRRE